MTREEAYREIKRLGGVGILTPEDIPDLRHGRARCLYLLADGGWHSRPEVDDFVGAKEATRRLRQLRVFFAVHCRRAAYGVRIFEYQLGFHGEPPPLPEHRQLDFFPS